MNLQSRIKAFAEIGNYLKSPEFLKSGNLAHKSNSWFTPDFVRKASLALAEKLTEPGLTKWAEAYPALKSEVAPKNIGVITAGNIPLVGFHDFLSVLISGNNFIGKTSSKETGLLKRVADKLIKINSGFKNRILFSDFKHSALNAGIATGSDNSARYFHYRFRDMPCIIRKNRNGTAILTGRENNADLHNLCIDVFQYFGLGCRNVSKIYVPGRYVMHDLVQALSEYAGLSDHRPYLNNLRYQRSLFKMDGKAFIDAGNILLAQNPALSSPIGVLHYEFYPDPTALKQGLSVLEGSVQCIVGDPDQGCIPFGASQSPELWDYADGVDTMDFLLSLS